ncbi:hypothetical protein OSB04_008387 [Centaurea solstitialis]|uniref:Receptor-like serine/threonine-protein kinase n=1 Tax=Centaurea solstitialis TaxID=347529 RepID=A0AA38WJF6_9ASTR|nr:hypothetical protein OSB04_008387 [Centaurea solstitialis]
MESISLFFYYFCFIISFNTLLVYCITESDTIFLNQTIKDGQTIVSAQQAFELGFFSPNVSENRYLGIWYKRQATGTVVWVANRETPIVNRSGELTLDQNGALVLYSSPNDRTVVWSSSPFRATRNPVARLLDTGNLVVHDREEDGPQDNIWQSFDHPGDTHLPGMKFGRSLSEGGVVVTNLTSWKSVDDPSQGQYMLYFDFNGYPQNFRKKGDVVQFRIGSWNGIRYTGNPSFSPNPVFTYDYHSNENETYAVFELIDHSVLTRITVFPDGRASRLNWVNDSQGWFPYLSNPRDNCTGYEICGAYASCDPTRSPSCGCLEGFEPNRRDELNLTSGCRRSLALDCGAGRDGFRKYSSLKLPDTRRSWYDKYMTLGQCKIKCQNECGCTAYTTLDISYNIGCLLWYDELIDMRTFAENGQDIYIRMAAAELARRIPIQQTSDLDLPLFSLSTLVNATNNFASENKLGEGGFGPVYKGCLEDEREVAVKRLSKCSLQGAEEFKNEVIFISKLQHRNLVKILGCCSEGQEKMLVYEYMPNKGLDSFIFHETKSKILDWSQRFHIINGIARGLLYLHQDSRLRIIHRDLKAANILLDDNMNPKISDFGMARSFRGNETETNTERVVGTYGYMSPEYAGGGIFSVKSDVFSFGVLVLEVVSGKRNRGFFHQAHHHNLLGHAWRLYQEGKSLELRDPCLVESHNNLEMLRSIHVGLLCVQHNPDDRPNMSTVVMMLSSEGQLREPQQPGFYNERDRIGCETSSSIQTKDSYNNVTVTLLEPR